MNNTKSMDPAELRKLKLRHHRLWSKLYSSVLRVNAIHQLNARRRRLVEIKDTLSEILDDATERCQLGFINEKLFLRISKATMYIYRHQLLIVDGKAKLSPFVVSYFENRLAVLRHDIKLLLA